MSIQFTDLTGEPQSIESLERALAAVDKEMREQKTMTVAPGFFVEILTIKHALEELIAIRRRLAEIQARKEKEAQG